MDSLYLWKSVWDIVPGFDLVYFRFRVLLIVLFLFLFVLVLCHFFSPAHYYFHFSINYSSICR